MVAAMRDERLPTIEDTLPTLLEAAGAALEAAGHPMASYRPPQLSGPHPTLGGCTPGWVAAVIPGAWVVVAFRPAGLMSDEDRAATQLNELQRYADHVFIAPVWQTMWNRRTWGFPALLVRRAERDE